MFLFFWGLGLFLLGMTPCIGIIGIVLDNSDVSNRSKQILRFTIVCQVITILLPLLLFLFTFLFLGQREQPSFIPYMGVCVVCVSLFCILASIIANIVYAATNKKTAFWGVLLQFAFVGAAFYAISFGSKFIE